jgi:imidazolonepropionase-like amidohydrolase
MAKTAITNALVFDGHSLHKDLTVIFENGLITSIDSSPDISNATIVDGTGQTLLPGLIDAHIHLINEPSAALRLLQQLLHSGITTALDMGYLKSSIRENLRNHPSITDILSADNYATSTGSIHSRFPHASVSSLIDSPSAAVEFVSDRVAEGADYIKIIADIPGPSQEVVNTLASEAQKAGKLSVAHAARKAAWAMAQEGKVDIITHVPSDFPLDEEACNKMREEGRVCIPTLIMAQTMANSKFIPGLKYESAKESVSLLHRAGVKILAGTDANQSPVAAVKYGIGLCEELELLVEAGLSCEEALRAATSLPAEAFPMIGDRGVITVGKRADLLLVGGNPVVDIKAVREVKGVGSGGVEVDLKVSVSREALGMKLANLFVWVRMLLYIIKVKYF